MADNCLVKCPYCGNSMQEGRLRSESRLCWIPKSQSEALFRLKGSVPEGHVALAGKFGYLKGHTVAAFWCSACKKVIADTE